jgi:hypothetical protein
LTLNTKATVKEVGGASIEQLKNMPYGEPKTGGKNKVGEK